jgi:hypothetical protein
LQHPPTRDNSSCALRDLCYAQVMIYKALSNLGTPVWSEWNTPAGFAMGVRWVRSWRLAHGSAATALIGAGL